MYSCIIYNHDQKEKTIEIIMKFVIFFFVKDTKYINISTIFNLHVFTKKEEGRQRDREK